MGSYGELWLCGLGLLVSLLLRCCLTLHPYSGQGKPPMYGDYEAQRHWMEITVNLPPKEWYANSSRNDLMYWGLDYPPLTAYHSYFCGMIARFIEPKYVELFTSRGYESEGHKLFMRYTVLFADILIYIPSICLYYYTVNKMDAQPIYKKNKRTRAEPKKLSYSVCIVLSLIYPGLILIDHGHFQYNCVSLGLAVHAVTSVLIGRNLLASVLFVLALNYKQMELYHALPFFIYLLSNCVPKPTRNIANSFFDLCKIGATVIATFGVLWFPFGDYETIRQVSVRLFPLARGVFEDKVSNFWCVLNVFYKLKDAFSNVEMARLCLIATVVAVLPSSIDLFLKPYSRKFVPALINSSLAFFLFSFQVHEKSVLLVAVPVILYFPQKPVMCFWFLVVSTFSMLPLLIKDGLTVAFVGTTAFYLASFQVAIDYTFKNREKSVVTNSYLKDVLLTLLSVQDGTGSSLQIVNLTFEHLLKNRQVIRIILLYTAFYASLLGCFVIFVLTMTVQPDPKYPDIFSLLVSVYSCAHFVMFFIYFNVCQFRIKQDFGVHLKYKNE